MLHSYLSPFIDDDCMLRYPEISATEQARTFRHVNKVPTEGGINPVQLNLIN